MNFEKVGRCIIINNKNFDRSTGGCCGPGLTFPAPFQFFQLVLRLVSDLHPRMLCPLAMAYSLSVDGVCMSRRKGCREIGDFRSKVPPCAVATVRLRIKASSLALTGAEP